MKTFKRLYTNGSSITHGWPLNQQSYRNEYFKRFGYEWDVMNPSLETDSKISINWPNRLADILNVEVVDESRGGGSSLRAMRMCMEWCEQNPNKVKDTLFVIETTSGYRDEIWVNELNRYFNLTITNVTNEEDITDNTEDRVKIKDVIEMYFNKMVDDDKHIEREAWECTKFISYMNTIGAEFFIVNQAIKEHMKHNTPNFYKSLNCEDRFVKFKQNDCVVQFYMHTMNSSLKDELNGFTDDYHPSYTAHKIIAEHIHTYIKKFYG